MALFRCNWYGVAICMCCPCISLLLCFIVGVVLLNSNITTISDAPLSAHFVAPGTFRNAGFAPMPNSFWAHSSQGQGFWNQQQLVTDRHHSPILRARNRNSTSDHDALRWQRFSEVMDLENGTSKFEKQPQQIKDFMSHMQQRDYPIILQPEGMCGAGAKHEKKRPLLLMAIKSSELNLKNRQAIRNTWGQVGWVPGHHRNKSRGEETGGYVRRVFLLGKENPEDVGVDLSEVLQAESNLYGDILQWDFSDTFFNLTLKDVLFWSWFSRACGNIQFVFKGDDDVFVNTLRLVDYLQDQRKTQNKHRTMKDFMVGHVITSALPSRDSNSKYYIPESFYKGSYPPYAGGGGVVYSGLLTRRLHLITKRVHLFPIDDVYVGMCMVRLNSSLIHHPAILTFDFPEKEKKEPCLYHRILLVHKRSPQQIVRLWADMKKTHPQCGDVPLRTTGQEQET